MKMRLYHGTSAANAKLIKISGFRAGTQHNWKVKSKKGFVYLSSAYAPFYAMASTSSSELALILVEVDTEDLYPEDDFLMLVLGKPVYSQAELNSVDFEAYKHLWKPSLEHMGNVAVKPAKTRVIGIRIFNGKMLLMKCDPVICPLNFKILGTYYKDLSDWIYAGNDPMSFRNMPGF